jgi:hypothetical protein
LNHQSVKRKRIVLAVAIALFACAGCRSADGPRIRVVFLPDLSKSIRMDARSSCLREIESASTELVRGDSFAVIPVTGDAANNASGAIVRSAFGPERESFDGDLVRILTFEHAGLLRIGDRKPDERTDLIGTVALASEELAHDPEEIRAVAVLSDFIQDRGRLNFMRDRRLADTRAARELAARLAGDSADLRGITVYLGELPSVSIERLPQRRRDAIKAFWLAYLARRGAKVEWATDGLGELPGFVSRLASSRRGRPAVADILGGEAARPDARETEGTRQIQ